MRKFILQSKLQSRDIYTKSIELQVLYSCNSKLRFLALSCHMDHSFESIMPDKLSVITIIALEKNLDFLIVFGV